MQTWNGSGRDPRKGKGCSLLIIEIQLSIQINALIFFLAAKITVRTGVTTRY